MPLRIPNIEEIQETLLKIPSLIDAYSRKDPSFAKGATKWLLEVELELQRNRLPLAATIASMRGNLVSAERGHAPALTGGFKTLTRRRSVEITAQEMLHQAVKVVSDRLDHDLALIDKAEESMFELVIVGRQLGLLPIAREQAISATRLRTLWTTLSQDELTRKYTVYVRSLVGEGDSLILLDRVLTKA